jgi:spore maturation protein CgeB
LAQRSHEVVFFERDTDYYRNSRDLHALDRGELVIYPSFGEIEARAALELESADAAIITSYCPDGVLASEMVLAADRPVRVFYDLDTPVTLASLDGGQRPPYLSEHGLGDFDLVLSYTGGPALQLLGERLGARQVAALYGHVDPDVHRPVVPNERFASELSYLGTYSADRQAAVEELLFAPAALLPDRRFALGGSLYPDPRNFPANVVHHPHLAPGEHAAFFCSSRATLNVTRQVMARLGHCPSGRLFEAAACGVPLLSDWFDGLDLFFEPGREIEVVQSRREVVSALSAGDAELRARASRARERVLSEHTAAHRAVELVALLQSSMDRRRARESEDTRTEGALNVGNHSCRGSR